MNKVFLIGRITKELELKTTNSGRSICDFGLAINRPFNKDGERVADFINCRVWGRTAENLVKYQNKGNLISVIGRLQVDKYQDKEGNNRYMSYVLVEELNYLEKKKEQDLGEQDLSEFEKPFDEIEELPF